MNVDFGCSQKKRTTLYRNDALLVMGSFSFPMCAESLIMRFLHLCKTKFKLDKGRKARKTMQYLKMVISVSREFLAYLY